MRTLVSALYADYHTEYEEASADKCSCAETGETTPVRCSPTSGLSPLVVFVLGKTP